MNFDEKGFSIKRFNEILEDIQNYQEENLGKVFNYKTGKIIYHLNAVFAFLIDQVYKLIEVAFDSLRLSSADGVHLEELALLQRIYRIRPAPGFTNNQEVELAPDTLIPANSRFTSSTSEVTAFNSNSILGDRRNCYAAKVRVSQVRDNELYQITINSTNRAFFISEADTNLSMIISGLSDELSIRNSGDYTFSVDGDTFIISATGADTIDIDVVNPALELVSVTTKANLELVEKGKIPVSANTIDQLQLPIEGFISTTNLDPFTEGRDRETDVELRRRMSLGGGGDCTGTIETIENALIANVPGVTTARVIENPDISPTDDEGRPVGSYEVVVVGATDEAVAAEVERTRPVGTPLVGNTSLFHTDKSGRDRRVSFTRPTPIHLAIRVLYRVYEEEQLSADHENIIEQSLLTQVQAMPLGKDFIPQRFYGPIYQQVGGIGHLSVGYQLLDSPGQLVQGPWLYGQEAISDSEFASVDISDIYIERSAG